MGSPRSAAEIRSDLGHPIIDADGHMTEHQPTLHQYCLDEEVDGGLYGQISKGSFGSESQWGALSPEDRLAHRPWRGPWWAMPMANTRDIATAVSPALYLRPPRGTGHRLRGVLPQHRARLPLF